MKRVFLLVFTAAMVLCLFGCGKAELPKEGPVGTTLKSDMVEVTLTDFGFAEEGVSIDEEKPDILCKPIPLPLCLNRQREDGPSDAGAFPGHLRPRNGRKVCCLS